MVISHRSCRRCSVALTEYRPCFHRAQRDLANPAAVRGPVLAPPCMRHLPFGMAGDWHGVALRVLAPQRGALLGSPAGFPFLSQFPFPILSWLDIWVSEPEGCADFGLGLARP